MSDWLKRPDLGAIRQQMLAEEREKAAMASRAFMEWQKLTQALDPHVRAILHDVAGVIISGGGWAIGDVTKMYRRNGDDTYNEKEISRATSADRSWTLESTAVAVISGKHATVTRPLLTMMGISAHFIKDWKDELDWTGSLNCLAAGGLRVELPLRAGEHDLDSLVSSLKSQIGEGVQSGLVRIYSRHVPKWFGKTYWIVRDVGREERIEE